MDAERPCRIVALGLNHRTAPLAVRERAAFPEDSQPAALRALVRDYGVAEAAVLSTCNRAELYLAGDGSGVEAASRFLAAARGIEAATFAAHFYALQDREAAAHLFRVACGLDSLVIGESQILSQVRDALAQAQRAGSAGGLLNELFQRALHVGKRARNETDIGRGRLSVATAAVELAAQIFPDLRACDALLVGAGEMGALIAQYLCEARIRRLWVASRTDAHAQTLAARVRGQPCAYASIPARLAEIDIAICATGAAGLVLDLATIGAAMAARRGRPLFLIDIAVPRDVDPRARDLDNVFLFDIDGLAQVVAAHRAERDQAIQRVESLIETELQDFERWLNSLEATPLLRALQRRAARLRQAELERWESRLEQLTPAQRQLVESILRGYANKLLHAPLVEIRRLAHTPGGPARLEAVRRLFALSEEDTDTEQDSGTQEDAR